MKNSKENDNGALSDAPELPSTVAKQYRAPPLLTELIVKAQREGKTMQHLARVLGVSYARLNQWRRGESHIANAQRDLFTSMLPGTWVSPLFLYRYWLKISPCRIWLWPDKGDLAFQVELGIHQLYDDCYIGGFVPPALLSASTSVKLFVLFLYRELNASARAAMGRGSASWISTLREAMVAEDGVRATGKLSEQGDVLAI